MQVRLQGHRSEGSGAKNARLLAAICRSRNLLTVINATHECWPY
jgi:hypothetical protein